MQKFSEPKIMITGQKAKTMWEIELEKNVQAVIVPKKI